MEGGTTVFDASAVSLKTPSHKLPIVPHDQRPSGCGHCPFSPLKVGSRGPIDSPFVIVGESPGAAELAKGYPFVGPSGEMLEAVLRESGLYESGIEPYITNALQCFPKEKTIPVMAPAVHGCQQRLLQELTAYPRKVILVLGAAAAWSVTNDFSIKITQERGKLLESPLAEVGVVTAVHPAFLMRQGSGFNLWKKDINYAVNLFLGKETPGYWNPPTYEEVLTREQYEALVEKYQHAKVIAGDIETGGRAADGTSYGLDFQRGYILSHGVTSDLDNGQHVYIIPGNVLWEHEDLTHRLMGVPGAKYVWQNGKFDIKFFRYEGIHEARVDEDTLLLSYTLNENKGHDLDTIAWDWIRAPNHKKVVDDWFAERRISRKKRDYAMLPQDLLRKYQAYDISKTFQAFTVLREEVNKDHHCKKLYERILIPAVEFLTRVEMKGLTLDPERVLGNDRILAERLAGIEAKIQPYAEKYVGAPINIASPKQLQGLLYNKMGLGPIGSSTDEDSLIKIQRKHDHPIAGHLLQWRKVNKQRTTYVKPALSWVGVDGRVHTDFKLHGTPTGRLASSDPNMQNIPRDVWIRGQFVAAPGKVLIELDLNQAELRVLAIMSGDPTLLEIYRKNEESIHHVTSVAMFGENYTDDEKMRAKAVNFGIVYGRTAPSIAEEFDISVKEAQQYIDIWLARYPKAKVFLEKCRNYPHEQKNMISIFGRKKRWGLISYDNFRNSENEAANWPCQSIAHDINLVSGIEVQPVLKERWNIDIVNEIHDALYLEADNDPEIYIPAAKYVKSVMERVPIDWGLTLVPFSAEAKVGSRWGGRKNAKDIGITDPELLAQYMVELDLAA